MENTTSGASKHETSQLVMSKATMNYSNDKLPVPFEEDYNAGPPQVLVAFRKALRPELAEFFLVRFAPSPALTMLDVDDTEVDTLMNTFNATMTETARTFEMGGQSTAQNCATMYTKVTQRYWMSNQEPTLVTTQSWRKRSKQGYGTIPMVASISTTRCCY